MGKASRDYFSCSRFDSNRQGRFGSAFLKTYDHANIDSSSHNTVPPPGMTIYLSIFAFVMASLLIFFANILLALSKAKLAKNDEEVEAIVAPAMQARDCDEQILKWTVIPRAVVCGVSLGAICAAAIHHFAK